jgi:hypothetical protein
MPYGEIRVDTITFTNGGIDATVTVSGIVNSTTGNLTVTGTVSGSTIRGQTISGVTVTGTTANFTSGNFVSISGNTVTVVSGIIASGTASNPSLSVLGDSNTGFYSPGADQLALSTSGTGRLFVDASGRVGIGTSLPNKKLEISDLSSDNFVRVNTTGAFKSGIEFSNGGTAYAQLYFNNVAPYDCSLLQQYSTGSLILGTNNTERARIDSSGRVGIGVTAPAATLHSRSDNAGSGSTPLLIQNRSISANTAVGISFAPNTSDTVDRSAVIYGVNSSGGSGNATDLAFHTNANGGSPSEKARLTSDGKLLVGTSSTSANTRFVIQGNSAGAGGSAVQHLCIDGATPASDDGLGYIIFGDNTQAQGAWVAAKRDGGTWSASSKPSRLEFSTTADGASSPTERMRIGSSGFTSLFVTANDGFQSRNSAAAGTSVACFAGRHSATGTADGTVSFIVWSNGNVVNTNNSYGAISDIKLKENIVVASSQWDDLKALQIRKYNFKEGQTHTQIGLIAQEVELISPGLVSESPDRDEEGNDLGTVTKSVNYSVLYMKAVKALQEAMERIETLEAKVAALEAA